MTLTATSRLGPYEVIAPLGAGGMGEVYKGRDTRLERTVAIKILPSELAGDPQFRDRFDREAKTISALNHPNICTLYDVGEAVSPALKAGRRAPPFATWSWNISKGRRSPRGSKRPLPLPDALRIGLDILNALEAAHRHGIVHRDLKPGNVMLTKSGGETARLRPGEDHPARDVGQPDGPDTVGRDNAAHRAGHDPRDLQVHGAGADGGRSG